MVIIETTSIRWIITSCDDVTYLASNVHLQVQRLLQGIDTGIPLLVYGHLKENKHTDTTILQ